VAAVVGRDGKSRNDLRKLISIQKLGRCCVGLPRTIEGRVDKKVESESELSPGIFILCQTCGSDKSDRILRFLGSRSSI